jgi:hypothetical protein
MPRLIHEITSYSIAALVCVPLWVILYLIAAAFVPVHTAMAVASFLLRLLTYILVALLARKSGA